MASTEAIMGSVDMWAMDWAPEAWALCNGQVLSIQTNPALFSLLGTTYGGNGTSTFGIPDMRGRVPIGMGQRQTGAPTYNVGNFGGNDAAITLTTANMPVHNHALTGTVKPKAATGKISLTNVPTNNYLGETSTSNPVYSTTATDNCDMGQCDVALTIGSAGGGQSFSAMPPFLCLNFIICMQGYFPSRP